MDFLENVGATGYTEPRRSPTKKKNQDKVVIKDVATILSTTGIESLATLLKKLSYHDNSPLVNCM